MNDDHRYPIGPAPSAMTLTADERRVLIDDIEVTPVRMRRAVMDLDEAQLDTPYREGGWTVRQVVHHVPDSHLNAYTRLKLALTEDEPVIRPYDEAAWAQLKDSQETPVTTSLALLEALHERWVRLLRSIDDQDFARKFTHPQHGKVFTIDWLIGTYAWHGKHHVAHITSLRERMGWN